MANDESPAGRYFEAIRAALDGLDVFLRANDSPLYRHDLMAGLVV